MSQELFGEALNMSKQETKQKRKLKKELSNDKLYTINLFWQQMETKSEKGLGDVPPPHLNQIENLYLF